MSDQDFCPFQDIEERYARIATSYRVSLIPDDVIISGAIYDVDTGKYGQS